MLNKKTLGNFFIVIAFCFMSLIYLNYIKAPHSKKKPRPSSSNSFSRAIHNAFPKFYPHKHIRAGSSSSVLGFLHGRLREQKKKILFVVSRIQTRPMPPLFNMQSLCPKHGPPLP